MNKYPAIFDTKFKLSQADRDQYDQLADLYSIIVGTEHLERAYLKSTITPQGVPATVEHGTESKINAKTIAETVQFFITLMDGLKLNIIAVDEVHPQLRYLPLTQRSDPIAQ
ncbi:Vacuolar protein-sorting-associated protein 28 [Boothiomyces sp. JEL0838]|nr:Vacuolar protein-sorting-associated protein 28 [Boothiomyces sp. JEL0838]